MLDDTVLGSGRHKRAGLSRMVCGSWDEMVSRSVSLGRVELSSIRCGFRRSGSGRHRTCCGVD